MKSRREVLKTAVAATLLTAIKPVEALGTAVSTIAPAPAAWTNFRFGPAHEILGAVNMAGTPTWGWAAEHDGTHYGDFVILEDEHVLDEARTDLEGLLMEQANQTLCNVAGHIWGNPLEGVRFCQRCHSANSEDVKRITEDA